MNGSLKCWNDAPRSRFLDCHWRGDQSDTFERCWEV